MPWHGNNLEKKWNWLSAGCGYVVAVEQVWSPGFHTILVAWVILSGLPAGNSR